MKSLNDLTIAMYALIDSATTESVYASQVPESATYPYAHFEFYNSNDQEGREDFFMNVNCWDKDYDSTNLLTLQNNIDRTINRYNYNSTGINFTCYRVNRMKLPSDDEFQGIELKYIVKTYLV